MRFPLGILWGEARSTLSTTPACLNKLRFLPTDACVPHAMLLSSPLLVCPNTRNYLAPKNCLVENLVGQHAHEYGD